MKKVVDINNYGDNVVLHKAKSYKNEHGGYVEFEFTKDGKPFDCILRQSNLLFALDSYFQDHCVKTGVNIREAGTFQE